MKIIKPVDTIIELSEKEKKLIESFYDLINALVTALQMTETKEHTVVYKDGLPIDFDYLIEYLLALGLYAKNI